jgi:chromosome partitioning protein
MRDAASSLKLSLSETAITLRQSYADAPGQATFVWNMGYSARDAAEEIDQFFQEILPEATSDKVLALRKSREGK